MSKPTRINMPNCEYLYEASNKIHAWFILERRIADSKARIKKLEADIVAEKESLKQHQKDLNIIRMDVISDTDPVKQYIEANK